MVDMMSMAFASIQPYLKMLVLKRSKDGNTEGLFQGSSSSSSSHQALMRAVEAENPGHAVGIIDEVII
jgi:hypothetical protein